MNKWYSKGLYLSIAIWSVLTVLLLASKSYFKIDDYVSSPQHGHFDNFNEITDYIIYHDKVLFYKLFFIFDFVWAFFTLFIIGYLIRDMDEKNMFSIGTRKISVLQVYGFFALFAYIFDILEGVSYLTYYVKYLENISLLKVAFYTICLAFLVYWALKKYVFSDFKPIVRFALTSILSLILISIVYLLLTVMPQGGTLVVYLFYSPWNIILLFFLLTFAAILVSHFPIYVDIWMYSDNDKIEIKMADRGLRLWGFGIIYFDTHKAKENKKERFQSKKVSAFRRSLGILLYVAVFNIFLGVLSRFYEIDINVNGLTLLIAVVTLVIYYKRGERYLNSKQTLEGDEGSEDHQRDVIRRIVKSVRRFPGYFLFCTLMVIITATVSAFIGWSIYTLTLLLITLALQMFLYLYFRLCRSYFKYVFYFKELKESTPKMFNPKVEKLFEKHDELHGKNISWFYKAFAKLSDNVEYLKLMQFSGYVALLLLLIANFNFNFASGLNPINIILLFLIVFYSVIIITFKHILYYHRNWNSSSRYRDLFRYGIPVFTVLMIAWFSYSGSLENDLHQLSLVEENVAPIDHNRFIDRFTSENNNGKKNNYFFVGSYGGGLKANLWNLLIFNELETETKNKFLERTIAMSGVSGGAVGIGNYASIVYESKTQEEINRKIDAIGNSNVLSNELVYLFGKDWVREYWPYMTYNGTDRSYKSMQNHARLTGMGQGYNTQSFSDYWLKMYRARNRKFPAFIMNTTSTSGNHGVASSVKFPENTFAGADLILNFENEYEGNSLSYFGTISTTNRFPLFSPTAKIPGKGSYLDGGYFENSGMLSVLEIYLSIAGDPSKKYNRQINPVFINIINSEDYYIEEMVLNEWGFNKKSLDEAGEISSILGTVVSIEKLPGHVRGRIEKLGGGFVEPIMMPHKITYEKVKSVLQADIDDPLRLMDSILSHNDMIDQALRDYGKYDYKKWGVVTPPLARVLSTPAVRYQEAMIKEHPYVVKTLQRIYEYVKKDTLINIEMQQNLKRRPIITRKGRSKPEERQD